jgi:hypothetical protein
MLIRLRSCLATAAAVLGMLLPCAQAVAGSTQAAVMVRATVLRHASIRIAPPRTITISEADIARGYVELAAPVEVEVESNVREGYTLVFERHGEQVRQAHVQGLQSGLLVGDATAMATRPAAGRGLWRELLQLRFRFDLGPQARPGQLPWPLDISMMSL